MDGTRRRSPFTLKLPITMRMITGCIYTASWLLGPLGRARRSRGRGRVRSYVLAAFVKTNMMPNYSTAMPRLYSEKLMYQLFQQCKNRLTSEAACCLLHRCRYA